tara:strand:- start:258028 stop:259380 length:1353 start_codon:yes stop_codon:yes gene_type:complete
MAFCFTSVTFADQFSNWLERQNQVSIEKLFNNIGPEGTHPGTVIASPSREEPDYWFHWVRDAALVMQVVLDRGSNVPANRGETLYRFVEKTELNQNLFSPVGLGEPKYYVDGRPYDGPWGRPQNDGPALRALTLTRWARQLMEQGRSEYVRQRLYSGSIPALGVIKKDLEYVAHNWRVPSFDLWEEVKGQHFYTKMVQRQALLEGADLAQILGDGGAAQYYRNQAHGLDQVILHHYNTNRPYIVENIDRVEGLWYKDSGLDTATILAFLHTQGSHHSKSLDDNMLLSTIFHLKESFASIYRINRNYEAQGVGVSFGRYPEDVYFGGNPWFLTTLAIAEHHLKLAKVIQEKGQISISPKNYTFYQALMGQKAKVPSRVITSSDSEFRMILSELHAEAIKYFKRVRKHTNSSGNLWEQFDRDSGYMLSARDLTWSYAAFITSYQALRDLHND